MNKQPKKQPTKVEPKPRAIKAPVKGKGSASEAIARGAALRRFI